MSWFSKFKKPAPASVPLPPRPAPEEEPPIFSPFKSVSRSSAVAMVYGDSRHVAMDGPVTALFIRVTPSTFLACSGFNLVHGKDYSIVDRVDVSSTLVVGNYHCV